MPLITRFRQLSRAFRPSLTQATHALPQPVRSPAHSPSTVRWSRPLQLHAVTPHRTVPAHITHPHYALPSLLRSDPRRSQHIFSGIEIKAPDAIAAMRRAGMYASYVREFAASKLAVGVSTDYIDECLHEECVRLNIYPSPLGYAGFPKSVCTSVNQVVCHGIPDARVLEEGDIVNIDVSVFVDGYHGDCSDTFTIGSVDDTGIRLIQSVREAVNESIRRCGPNTPFAVIGNTCQSIAERENFSIVKDYCGHGIGADLHQPPYVWHHRNTGAEVMQSGMTFTIEPMFCEGTADTAVLDDGWTVVTRDGQRSAQCEQTVLITDSGCEVLTKH